MPSTDRLVLYPIRHPAVWEMYKRAQSSLWTAEEIDLADDVKHWATFSPAERKFVTTILAFFAASDGIVLENLVTSFCSEVQIPEARCFYAFQAAMENVHAETYSLLIDTLIVDPLEKTRLLRAVETIPVVAAKAEWALAHIDGARRSFAERLLAFAVVEGVMFSASFCAIFWVKKRGLMPGLTFSNELIARDEGLHTDFACLLYGMLINPLSTEGAHDIIRSGVDLEHRFVREALAWDATQTAAGGAVTGITPDTMCAYVEFVADRLAESLGYPRIYNTPNPFLWMESISLQGKTNFFERRVGEYQKAGVMAGASGGPPVHEFRLDADF